MVSSQEVQVGEGDLTISVGIRDHGQAEGLLYHLGRGERRGGVNSSSAYK